jgi:hypothetical protein
MNKLRKLIFIKNKLTRPPINIFCIKDSVDSYEKVIEIWKKFKLSPTNENYEIYSIFTFHLHHDNHVIMYHSKDKENSLIMCKMNNKYFHNILPYLEINNKMILLKKTNFVACYD